MANSAQAQKRSVQAEKQRAHNMSLKTAFRTAVKKTIKAIASGSKDDAQRVFQEAAKTIDSIADKGIFHKNKAARHKSRLSQRIKEMTQ